MDCANCLEHDRHRLGFYRRNHGLFLCDDCDDSANEDANERSLSRYYGSSSPQSDSERAEVVKRDCQA